MKNGMKYLIVSLLLVSANAWSATELFGASGELVSYDCKVIVVGSGDDDLLQQNFFTMQNSTSAHGALQRTYENKVHKVIVMADGRWMGFMWYKNGKLVAQSVFCQSEQVVEARALILYNPEDPNDQASLDCTKSQ
jgi:hypothetical protein